MQVMRQEIAARGLTSLQHGHFGDFAVRNIVGQINKAGETFRIRNGFDIKDEGGSHDAGRCLKSPYFTRAAKFS
jgi:hypothetical protein